MSNQLVFHKSNGAVSLQKMDEKGKEVVHSEIAVRFVYADDKLLKRLLKAVEDEYRERGLL